MCAFMQYEFDGKRGNFLNKYLLDYGENADKQNQKSGSKNTLLPDFIIK